ncbi:MAG: hypothetical protein KatS3mg059_1654 [Thermomicrobiales bacterium]|nr:MAG: hypothetical protein KatS3mg059_1654 [Thermomicrobiales bacterium]
MDNPDTLAHDLCCALARIARHASSASDSAIDTLLDQARKLLGGELAALIVSGASPADFRLVSDGDVLTEAELAAVEAPLPRHHGAPGGARAQRPAGALLGS